MKADVIVTSHQTVIDPRLKSILSEGLSRDDIIVIDDCASLEEQCIDAMSLHINRGLLEQASQ